MEMTTLEFDCVYRMVRLDNPSLGFQDALDIAARIVARPGLPGACIHRMPEGLSAVIGGKCIRCNSKA